MIKDLNEKIFKHYIYIKHYNNYRFKFYTKSKTRKDFKYNL